jgi:ArsR family transcriptional regulator
MIGLADTTRLMRALGDETRLRLLRLLSQRELGVSELVEILNVAQSRISAHLALLKEVGLVADRRLGRRSIYELVHGPAETWVRGVLESGADSPEFEADRLGLLALEARQRQEARSYFDRVAATFGEQILPGRTWEGLCRALLCLLPGGRYVDLGIGDGLLTLMLAEIADSVTAVDLSPEMLAQLAQRAHRAGLNNIETVPGELDRLPLSDQSFDVAVLSQALHHAEEPRQALAEAFRILRPGGRLLIIDLASHAEEWVREKLQHRHLGFSEPQLSAWMAAAGFTAVRVQRAARDPHPPHFLSLVAIGQRPPAAPLP